MLERLDFPNSADFRPLSGSNSSGPVRWRARYLIDDFIIQHFRTLRKSDFVLKEEDCSSNRKGKRAYLRERENSDFIKKLNKHSTSIVEVPRTKVGDRQEIETLISEEAFLFAKYLRNERIDWIPRIPTV